MQGENQRSGMLRTIDQDKVAAADHLLQKVKLSPGK